MLCATLHNCLLWFNNPFKRYILDLDTVGTLDIVSGFLSKEVHTYHLNRISELQMHVSPKQRIFGTGTIQFNVHEYNQISTVIIENIKHPNTVYGALSYYKQSIMRK